MNGSVVAFIEAVSRSLREAVLPELATDYARSQVAGAMDILAKLERMTDWQPAMLQEEQAALQRGIDAIQARVAAAGVALAGPAADGPGSLEGCQEHIRGLCDWMIASALEPGLRAEVDALLRAALRESLAVQRARIPRADFSSMTGSEVQSSR